MVFSDSLERLHVSQQSLDTVFQEWHDNQALAEQMIPLIGSLYRHNNVVTTLYGRSLFNRSVIRILKDHRFVRKVEGTELSVQDTLPLVQAMAELNLRSEEHTSELQSRPHLVCR